MKPATSALSRVLRPVLATAAFAGLLASARAASRYHDRRKPGQSLRPWRRGARQSPPGDSGPRGSRSSSPTAGRIR